MIKKFGFGKTLLFYTLSICLFVCGVGFLLLYSSHKAVNSLSQTSQSGLQSYQDQMSLIKSMAQVHSNVFPILAEKDLESRSIRLDIAKGFMDEFAKQILKCGDHCSSIDSDFKKYQTTWNDIVTNHINKNDLAGATDKTMNALNPVAESLFDKLDKSAGEIAKSANAEFSTTLTDVNKVKVQLSLMLGFLVLAIIGIGILFQKVMVRNFQQVSTEVSGAVSQTAAKATEILESSEKLSSATTKQAAAIEETVASLEELSAMVQRNAEHAQAAANLSQESSTAASTGGEEITKLITAMKDIYDGSRRIEEIINVIDDIAFQTNLLALNAAVEAARAGEQGKGFAVVADAVRTLAQRSAGAAKEIGSLIQESVHKTQNGTKIADHSGSALQDIIRSIHKVVELNQEISQASREQASGIQQLSKAMTQIDQSTQTNAAVAQELAGSSDVLQGQSNHLQHSIGELRQLIQGEAAARESAASDAMASGSADHEHDSSQFKKSA